MENRIINITVVAEVAAAVDLTLNIISLNHWQEVQEKLGALGFHPNPFGHAICSYKYKDIPVDIMATEDGPFGPSNSWFKPGFANLWTTKVKEQEIKILSSPYYLATKFEAFKNRGKDYRTSQDIEDIIYVIDNRMSIVEEVKSSEPKVRTFLKQELLHLKQQGLLREVLISHIHPLMIEERLPLVEEKVNDIIKD